MQTHSVNTVLLQSVKPRHASMLRGIHQTLSIFDYFQEKQNMWLIFAKLTFTFDISSLLMDII